MVDERPHVTPTGLHILAKSGKSLTTNGPHVTTQWIPPPDWSFKIGPMRMWPSKGNGQALYFPMHDMGGIPNANAGTDKHKKRQPLILLGRESTS